MVIRNLMYSWTLCFQNFRILAERVNNHVMGEADSTPERRQSISPNIDSRPGSGRFSRPSSRPSSPSRSASREEATFVRRLSSTLDTGDKAAMPPPQSPISTLWVLNSFCEDWLFMFHSYFTDPDEEVRLETLWRLMNVIWFSSRFLNLVRFSKILSLVLSCCLNASS